MTWVLTVASLRNSAPAISAFDRPRAIEPEHVELPARELRQRGGNAGVRAWPAHVVGDQPARDLRREQGIARRHDAHRLGELRGRRVLEQEAARARAHRLVDVLVEVERGEHEDPGPRLAGDEPARRLDAVQPRHAHVHEHDVRLVQARELDGLRAVRRLADDGDVGLRLEDHAKAAADQRLIVGQQDADHGVLGSGRRARTR